MNLAGQIPNIPRIHTAVAEWLACMVYVLIIEKRYKDYRLWLFSLLFLCFFCGLQFLAGIVPLWLWIPGMATAILSMYFMIFGLGRLKWHEAIYWTARAFIVAEFAASLEWQLSYFVSQFAPNINQTVANQYLSTFIGSASYMQWIILALVYAGIYALLFFLERRYTSANKHLNITWNNVLTAAGLALVMFIISNMSFITSNSPVSGTTPADIFNIRTLVDFCGIVMLFVQQEQRLWLYAKQELFSMRNVLTRQYEQYSISKENIDFLNRRYHDLRHHIEAIRAEGNPEKKEAYLDELEKAIKIYEAQAQTGNTVLDVILTGKSRLCVESGINLTCVADGALLNFMDVMDVCSIVGNALDNAIESVSKLGDADKRLIKMAVYTQNDLLIMRFENYLEDKPVFENGLPMTTKQDKREHGYGIKSIKSAAEKYDGSVSVRVEDGWFILCLLIPFEKNA